VSDLRIPFAEAISEPRLLRNRWSELSLPQQVVLKGLYGLPLSQEVKDQRGWSEVDYWHASQGAGQFDELGYLTGVDYSKITPYEPMEYSEAWLNQGVRSGKSSVASFIVSYEAVCGGHEADLRQGRRAYCFQVAQDLRQAKYALHDIVANLESIPFLASPLKTGAPRMGKPTADRVDLWNGMTVMTTPPTVKSVRGYDSPCAVMDEVAVWYQDADSANPDFEVYRQLKSRQAQFDAQAVKLIGLSSPWNKGGLLWQRCKAGTKGSLLRCEFHDDQSLVVPFEEIARCRDCAKAQRPHRRHLVMTMPTAAMGNPLVSRTYLEEQQSGDPRAFRRECLAEFLDSVSGFLDPDLLHASVSRGIVLRDPIPGCNYVGAIDPAFKRDSFALCIGHVESGGRVVYDYVKRWERAAGDPPLNPEKCLQECFALASAYGLTTLFTDQHEVSSLKVLANQMGKTLAEISLQVGSKAEIWGSFASLLNQRKVSLLDHEESINELLCLERALTQGGNIAIGAPNGMRDDLATVHALVASQAIWLPPQAKNAEKDEDPYLDIHARIAEQIAQKWRIDEEASDWDI
jgi:hypothetical protein